jgi:adenosylcobalamin-dependent ribonucleoside-diphosphate reductase
MAIAPERTGIGIRRYFTSPGTDPYETLTWERRDARITNWQTGAVAFEQPGVEVPASWSQNATNILAQKYFRGTLGARERESSLRQVVDRVAGTIAAWGKKDGYFADKAEADAFEAELKWLIVHQRAAFNSPVWFNIGVAGVPQQASACFILSVEDSMDSILNWYVEEGKIFKGGSGAGINLSKIRSSKEGLRGGGTASGPVSFMRGADASAGTIKSGGKTRRAAKMVLLNADHPDIEDFIWCKAIEERKARALRDAGFDMDLDGKDSYSIQYQNANNSVRVTDEFMQAVLDDRDWELRAVTTGEVLKTVKARDLFRQIAKAAWECADPGLQFDTTINRWHTAPNTGRINASNPCSEYLHLDNSACNLASLNLLAFLGPDGTFDVEGFKAAVEVVFTAQEILVGNADYPTKTIADTSRRFRELGLGYANLGALLMAQGLPYDSDAGRAWAGAITALMTGHAYTVSARTAARMGPFAGYHDNKEAMLEVLRMHRAEVAKIDEELVPPELLSAAQEAWDTAVEMAEVYGVRNSQATVLAPTGTIGLLLDCDTTGIEPDLSLVKTKKLVGGGTMSIVNQTVPRALRRLGYSEGEVAEITAYIDEHKSIVGAPHVRAEHLPVFACSMGDNTIDYRGHVKMMAAAQPFISGAISKCVTAETLVATGDGLVRIGSLYGGEGAGSFRPEVLEVASLEGTEKTDAFYYGGVKPVLTVTLRSGLKLTGTPNHRVLSAGRGGFSWRRLDELKEGELVAARYGMDMWSVLPARLGEGAPRAEMSEELAFFLGAYVAEGTLDQESATVSVACEDAFTEAAIEGAFRESFGGEVVAEVVVEAGKHVTKLRSRTAARFLEQLGRSEGRHWPGVPDCVLRSPREMVLAFLQGLFQGAQVSGEKLCKWAFNAKSAQLASDLQAVLANLGVVTGRAGQSCNGNETCAEIYATREFARQVVELVPFLDPGKQASALKLCGQQFPPEVNDIVPGISGPELLALAGSALPGAQLPGPGGHGANYVSRRLLERAAALPGAALPWWLQAVLELNLHFSAIESVADAGEREVFDLSVPGSHSFVGNGIVNHNTVNMPEEVTVEDVEQLYIEAWQLGVKAIAIYRDNCKVAQPLATTKKAAPVGEPSPEARDEELARKVAELEKAVQNQTTVVVKKPVREHMPRKRRSQTFSFRVADCEGYVTVGEFPDGRPGEVFISVSKQGSTLAGVMDAFAISVSMGLQHGVPLSTFVRHFTNMRFEPAGMTDDPELRFATSLVDYIFRRLAVEYMSPLERADLGILTVSERMQPTLPGVEEAVTVDEPLRSDLVDEIEVSGSSLSVLAGPSNGLGPGAGKGPAASDAPYCYQCGVQMQRAGSCFACPSCGTTSGCS